MKLIPVVVAALGVILLPVIAAAQNTPPPTGIAPGGGVANAKGHYAALDALPDWGGVWFVVGGASNGGPAPLPKLKGAYLKRYEAWRTAARANQAVTKRTRSNCSPPGLPRIMRLGQYPYEFVFAPGRVIVNQEAWMQTRTIWTDGRAHEDDPDPTFMGDSIGRWDGDTLVVDTIGISDALEIDTGIPHSAQFHLTERIHLDPANPDVLINDMRMEDPAALTEPFEVAVKYRRDRYGKLLEFQCSENDRNPVDENGNTGFN
ncbi:MAG: hypothetical protein ABIT09_13200 [Croceibacterium sp.]